MSNTQCRFFYRDTLSESGTHTVLATKLEDGTLQADLTTKSPDLRSQVSFCGSLSRIKQSGDPTIDDDHRYSCTVKLGPNEHSCMLAGVGTRKYGADGSMKYDVNMLVGNPFLCKPEEHYCLHSKTNEAQDYGVVDAMPSLVSNALVGLGVLTTAMTVAGAYYLCHSSASVAYHHEHID